MVAWAAAGELSHLSLADAIAVLLLQVDVERPRYERALVRWHARLCVETPRMTAREATLVLAALQALGGPGEAGAASALREICAARGLDRIAAVIESWARKRR